MHVMPRISWLNWVRLALIPAGGDWRDLPGVLEGGQPRRTKFRRHPVQGWQAPSATVAGSGSNGPENVADPRPAPSNRHWNKDRVEDWQKPAHTVIGKTQPGSGGPAAADPRARSWYRGVLRVVPWREPNPTVTAGAAPSRGPFSVADPRVKTGFDHGYAVLPWDAPSFTVAGGSHPGQGAYAVGDPRVESKPRAGAYGLLDWNEAAKTITSSASIDNGPFAVVDPRHPEAPPLMVIKDIRKAPPAVPVILSEDGTWHRPLTTLELAVLQGFPWWINGGPLVLSGTSSSAWRERIGNAVPPPAARSIAEQMLVTLVHADAQRFALGSTDVWVVPPAEALEVS
jgi:site-specific DNA-cytosine methylase